MYLEEKYIYHVSPSFNDESIKQNGFLPTNQSYGRFEGNWIYFTLGSYVRNHRFALSILTRGLRVVKRKDSLQNFDLWTVYKLRTPTSIDFQLDPEGTNGQFVRTQQMVP